MSNDTWERLCRRLTDLGWKPHSAEGFTGLMSPHDTMFVDARATTAEGRDTMVASLRQRLATMLDYKNQGFFPDETKSAFDDTQQLLDCLLEQ
jgi:hypothetical protein